MKNAGSMTEQNMAQIRRKRNVYTILVIVWLLFPVVGYLSEVGWVFPRGEELRFLPLNYGAYGLAGIFVVYLFIALAGALVAFVGVIRSWRSLMGVILGIIAFAAVVGFATGLAEIFFSRCASQLANWLSENISDYSIPGISKTLGIAGLCSLLYDVPCAIFIWRCVTSWRRCGK